MHDWFVAVAVGGMLIVIGTLMIRAHLNTWREQRQDTSLDEMDRKHYYRRLRRRTQTSALIVVLGILIPLGDSPFVWGQGPAVSTLCWIAALIITGWIILLALADLVATRSHARVALSRIQQKQRELEGKVEELRKRGSNGRPRSIDR